MRSEKKTERNQAVHTITITRASLARQLLGMGIKGCIPSYLWSSRALLSAYLRGLFDGDGGVSADGVHLTFGGADGRYHRWLLDVQLALECLGIRSRVHRWDQYRCVRLHVIKADVPEFCRVVGFLNEKKQRAAEAVPLCTTRKGNAAYGRACSIDRIEELPDEQMYDFLESSTGRFWADGMIVHNSGAQGILKLAMAEVHYEVLPRYGADALPVLQIHDELLFEAREEVAEDLAQEVKRVMSTVVPLLVPVESSSDVAETWGDLK